MLLLALAMIIADGKSPSSRALAAGLALMGTTAIPDLVLGSLGLFPLAHWWPVYFSTVGLSLIAYVEWLRLVIKTIPERDHWTTVADVLLRLSQAIQLITIACFTFFADEMHAQGTRSGPIYHVMSHFFVLADLTFALPMLILLFRKPDLQERQRVIGVLAAMPFFIATEFVESDENAWVLLRIVGILVALIGVMKFHIMQGQRGQFLSRFLSPQVGDMVRAQGLMQVLQQNRLEISVVSCDLRGFTAYAQNQPAENVIGVLRDYYNAVSHVAAQFGGTIKDIAGDGILILVGAPIQIPNHAERALEIAQASCVAITQAIHAWKRPGSPLGIGIGVASGSVTAGVIDAAFRLEYAAIGPSVNLASRLCAYAKDGEILVSERTAELNSRLRLMPRDPIALKGIGDAVLHYSINS